MEMGKTRRGKGEGGIRIRDNGNYEGTFNIHKENGQTIRKSFVRKTKNEILDIMAKLRGLGILDNNVKDVCINKYTNEIRLVKIGQSKSVGKLSSNITFKEYAIYYLEKHRKNGLTGRKIEETTYTSYVDKVKMLNRYIGNKKVVDLEYEDLEECIDKLHEATCDTTTKQARDILVSIMKFAKKDGITEENVLQDEKLPIKEKKGRKERKILQGEDLKKFIDYCKENKEYDLLFMLCTGIRVSELSGVVWSDICAEKGTVSIEREYKKVYIYDKLEKKESKKIFKDLKTKHSQRVLGLDETMINILKEHKESQKQLAKRNGKEFTEEDWVFTTKNYTGYLSDYASDKFKKIVRKLQLKDCEELTTHCLRHTFCSMRN